MNTGSLRDAVEPADLLLVSGVLVVVASTFLPWITTGSPVIHVDGSLHSSVDGIQTPDGQLVLGGVLVCGALAAGARLYGGAWGKLSSGFAALAGLVAVGVGYLYLSDPVRGAEGSESALTAAEPGAGLYVVVVGGVLVLASAVVGLLLPRDGQPDGE